MGLTPGTQRWLNIHQSINVIHIYKLKNKNDAVISIDAEKAFDKIQHLFLTKIQQSSIEGTYCNIIKAIYDNSATNTTLDGEKLKSFPSRSGTR